jgi:hypothetical protein
MNLLNWKDRDGNGSVTWTAHSTYEIERLEVVTGVFWVSRPTPCQREGAGHRGWRDAGGAKIIAKADSGRRGDLRQGYAPSRARARVGQLLAAAFAAFGKNQ